MPTSHPPLFSRALYLSTQNRRLHSQPPRLDALERDLQRPVVSANQASLWHCLRLSGVRTPVGGYGNLLRL